MTTHCLSCEWLGTGDCLGEDCVRANEYLAQTYRDLIAMSEASTPVAEMTSMDGRKMKVYIREADVL